MTDSDSPVLEVDVSHDAAGRRVAAVGNDVRALRVRAAMGGMPIDALGAIPREQLSHLELLEAVGDIEPACQHRRDLVWRQLPALTYLVIRSERPMFHSIEHDRLETLVLEVSPLCEAGRWRLPHLRNLEVSPQIESDCDIDALDVVFRQKLPGLRSATFRGDFVTHEPTLGRKDFRTFIRGLERLALPESALVPYDGGEVDLAATLLANAASLAHLDALLISNARLRSEAFASVAAKLPNLRIEAPARPSPA